MGWHTARTLLPPPPPRSSGAPVRWLMARGRRASGVAAAPRSRAAGAPATRRRRAVGGACACRARSNGRRRPLWWWWWWWWCAHQLRITSGRLPLIGGKYCFPDSGLQCHIPPRLIPCSACRAALGPPTFTLFGKVGSRIATCPLLWQEFPPFHCGTHRTHGRDTAAAATPLRGAHQPSPQLAPKEAVREDQSSLGRRRGHHETPLALATLRGYRATRIVDPILTPPIFPKKNNDEASRRPSTRRQAGC